MASIPAWIGALGALLVIAAGLGSAVAVYRTNIQSTSLREAERTIERLRGDITDYERREADLQADVRVLEEKDNAKAGRIQVLEDLLTKRKDDDEIRAEIAAVRKVVDENVISQLSAILQLLNQGEAST
jgi:chromosome segregation ATPase